MKRLQEIKERKLEIRSMLEADNVDLEVVESELNELEKEERSIVEKQKVIERIQVEKTELRQIEKPKEERGMTQVIEQRFEDMTKEELLSAPEYRNAFLKELMGQKLTEVEERAITTAGNSAGGAIPTQTGNMIIDKLVQTSVLFNRVSVSYIAGNVSFVVAAAKNDAAWKAEGTDGNYLDDTVATVSLTGHELIKLVEISAKVQAMSISAFEAYITAEIARKMAVAFENAILNGTGANQPTGILTGVTWGAGNSTTFTKTGGMVYKDLVKILAMLPTMYHNNAVIVMPRALFFNDVIGMQTTAGEPVVVQNPQAPMQFNVLGYPVIIDDYMPVDTLILGDLSYYKLNVAQAPSIESDRSVGFRSGKVAYRGFAIADGKPALDEAFVKATRSAT